MRKILASFNGRDQIRKLSISLVSLVTLLLISSQPARAHRPLWGNGSGEDADHAIQIEDVNVSQVVYYEITSQSPRLWLTFDAQGGQRVYIELGVPVIDRLKNFRPALAVLGPHMPPITLSFEIPLGLGGQVFETDTVKEPRIYHEPLTGTDSWVLQELRFTAPSNGKYLLVAYGPSTATGKLWVALGEQEKFGPIDIFRFPGWRSQARRFHEIN